MRQFRWLTALVVGAFLLSLGAMAFALTQPDAKLDSTAASNQAEYWEPRFGECSKFDDDGDEYNNLVVPPPPPNSYWTAIIVKQAEFDYVFLLPQVGDELDTGGAWSHWIGCWMDAGKSIEVTKTADATWTREHFWDIDKRVETEKGDTVGDNIPKIWLDGPSTYEETATWYVDVTYGGFEDRDFVVSGTITIENIAVSKDDKEIDSITDDLGFAGYSDIAVDCPVVLPYMLAFGEKLTCTYEVDLTGEAEPGDLGTNRVDVVVTGDSNEYFATDDWAFGLDPDAEINECVTITDTNPGFGDEYPSPVQVCVGVEVNVEGDSKEFSYSDTFAWEDYDDLCGSGFDVENTAEIVETEQTADALLKINVRCEDLDVIKTVVTYFEREHFWDIDKKVETEKRYTVDDDIAKIWLFIDGSGNETATWTVDVTYEDYVDSGFNVSGVITIENTGQLPAVITAIDDVLGGTPIDVDCGVDFGFPYTLGAEATLECRYDEDGYFEGNNEVTVTTERADYGPVIEEIKWGDPEEINKTVNIQDISDLFGTVNLGSVTAPDGDTFTYDKDFVYSGEAGCGSFQYDNTATIVETEQSASATLKVNVQCYVDETAYAMGGDAICFIPTFAQWGWTNPIDPGEYTWELWAGAAQCETSKGTLVGSVTVLYDSDGDVEVSYDVSPPYDLLESHVYAGYDEFPTARNGRTTVAPGRYTNNSPFDGSEVYVIAHAVVGMPDPNFGP